MNGSGKQKKAGQPKAAAKVVTAKPAIKSALDLDTVRALAEIIEEFGLTEVEADPSGHVRVRRELATSSICRRAPSMTASAGS